MSCSGYWGNMLQKFTINDGTVALCCLEWKEWKGMESQKSKPKNGSRYIASIMLLRNARNTSATVSRIFLPHPENICGVHSLCLSLGEE